MTIFYTPLSQVYAAANVGDLVGDLKVFLDDLIGVVEGKGAKGMSLYDRRKLVQNTLMESRSLTHQPKLGFLS